jgi:HSP20 family protein
MTVSRWDPMEELVSMRDVMDRMFGRGGGPARRFSREALAESRLRLPLDAYATDEEIVILASVPGVDPDEVEITLEGDNLTIKGEIKPPMENVDWLLNERAYGQFSRTLILNVPVNIENAEAHFDQGVLKLVLPKAEETRPKTIKVKTKKSE